MPAPEESQPGTAHLLDRLGPELGEAAVVSLAAVLDHELWRLRFGSVIVGPPALAEQSWPEWQSPGQEALLSLLDTAGYPARVWRSFDHVVGRWRFLRFALPVGDLHPWLARLFDEQTASHPFDAAPVSAVVAPADALLRTFPHQETSVSGLVVGADRPLIGWVHPLPIEGEDTPEAPPSDWQLGEGHPLNGAPLQLAGFATQSAKGLLNGLLIGRMEPGMVPDHSGRKTGPGDLRGSPRSRPLAHLALGTHDRPRGVGPVRQHGPRLPTQAR